MSGKRTSVFYFILIGQLLINAVVTLVIISTTLLSLIVFDKIGYGVLVGFGLAWLYWAFVTPKWRKWAIRKGADKKNLEYWANKTFLTWKEDNPLSKTEFGKTNQGD